MRNGENGIRFLMRCELHIIGAEWELAEILHVYGRDYTDGQASDEYKLVCLVGLKTFADPDEDWDRHQKVWYRQFRAIMQRNYFPKTTSVPGW
jgi:hypothetical protein